MGLGYAKAIHSGACSRNALPSIELGLIQQAECHTHATTYAASAVDKR